jgi:aldehyde:ferredoxin oxidoreductase
MNRQVTCHGWNFSWSNIAKVGERSVNLRHTFNLWEGINELKWPVPGRIVGKPPQIISSLAGVTADIEAQVYWYLGALGWDRFTTNRVRRNWFLSAALMMWQRICGRRKIAI